MTDQILRYYRDTEISFLKTVQSNLNLVKLCTEAMCFEFTARIMKRKIIIIFLIFPFPKLMSNMRYCIIRGVHSRKIRIRDNLAGY